MTGPNPNAATAVADQDSRPGPPPGPYDVEDLVPDTTEAIGLVDFGSLLVPVPWRGRVLTDPGPGGRLQAVHIAMPEGRLSVSALAAPKSSRLWPELATEIDESLRTGGARVRSYPGDWGRELHATTGGARSVFVGVDGPRWMLYGVATGPEVDSEALDAQLRRMLRATIVVRGRAPYPVRTVLPLEVPEQLTEQAAEAGGGMPPAGVDDGLATRALPAVGAGAAAAPARPTDRALPADPGPGEGPEARAAVPVPVPAPAPARPAAADAPRWADPVPRITDAEDGRTERPTGVRAQLPQDPTALRPQRPRWADAAAVAGLDDARAAGAGAVPPAGVPSPGGYPDTAVTLGGPGPLGAPGAPGEPAGPLAEPPGQPQAEPPTEPFPATGPAPAADRRKAEAAPKEQQPALAFLMGDPMALFAPAAPARGGRHRRPD